ncbi:polynucleotide 3'-phosphatase ZDP-like [Euphorbia lathyris]|uniref:polynucleotide 3'-phosphatase ZDP-like n=1 Tax=Euphorbia lathyris TaxID=212925 RepID=UPI003313D838
MITTFNLFGFPRNSILPLRISLSDKNIEVTSNQSRFPCVCFQKRTKQLLRFSSQNPAMPPSKAVKILAEYAKSKRSSCKKCSQVIQAKTLRLGLVSRDPRGFDMTKWHHLDCFSEKVESTEEILGFASLKENDQEALKKVISGVKDVVEGSPNSASERMDESGEELQLKGKISMKRKKTVENGEELELEEKITKLSKSTDENEDELELEEEETSKKKKRTDDIGKELKDKEKISKQTKLTTLTEEAQAQLEITFSLADIKDEYKGAKLLPKWKAFQTIIFLERDDDLHDSNKIAAFDFDGCLAKTHVQRVGAQFWSLMYPSIPEKLHKLYNDGYKLVIFTNESNIDRWKNKRQVAVDSKLGRLSNFIKHVKVPIQVFVACGYSNGKVEDPFRKPKHGMWQIMEKHFNSGISIDMDQSFYVGDAAGRINDHSDADIKFAKAIGLKFLVPEDYFGA